MPSSALAGRDRSDQVAQVLGHRRVGVVIGEPAVDLREQQAVASGQTRGKRTQDLAGRTIAGVPDDRQLAPAGGKVSEQPLDVGVEHRALEDAAAPGGIGALGGNPAELLDPLAIERGLAEHHLEAVVARRIVRAGHLEAAVRVQVMDREVEHRRRSAADREHLDAARAKTVAQRLGQLGRAQPAVEAEADPPAAGRAQDGRIGPPQRTGVGRRQRLADDAANVVLAQDGRMEDMPARAVRPCGGPAHALFLSRSTPELRIGRPMLV